MPLTRTYDDPEVMFRLRPDGQSAEHITVMGKDAFDKAVEAGWNPMEQLPRRLPFPTTLYRPDGSTKIVQDQAEKDGAMAQGWETTRYPAPVRRESYDEKVWAAEPGSPASLRAAQEAQAGSNARLTLMEQENAALKAQIAEILELQRAQSGKKSAKKDDAA